MMLFLELLTALLAAFGLVCLGWLAFGAMVLPVGGGTPVRVVVTPSGGGEGLEQAVSGLLWLRRSGMWSGELIIESAALDSRGLALAQRLAKTPGTELI